MARSPSLAAPAALLASVVLALAPSAEAQPVGRLQGGGFQGGVGVLPVLADQLVAESDRFVGEVRFELGGTRQGRNLEIRGNALLGATDSYRRELMLRHADEGLRLRAFDGVELALAEVRRELNSPPGTAPRAAESARRIDRLVAEIRGVYSPGFGPGIIPPSLGYDAGRLANRANSTATAARMLMGRIGREVGPFPPYDGVLRDLDGIASGLERLGDLARRQANIAQLQTLFDPIRNQARYTGMALQGARPPAGIARAWQDVGRGLDEVARLLGLGGDFVIDPNRPVIVNPPGFDQFPWPILPGGGGGGFIPPPPTSHAVPLLDQAIGELDAYLVAIQPNLSAIPEGPQFHRDARELRGELLALRQGLASGGWNPSVGGRYGRAEEVLRRLVDRTARVSRGQIGPNNARILRVRDLVAQVRPLLGSPGPTPY